MILVFGCRENRYVVVLWKIGVKMYISRVKLYNWKNFGSVMFGFPSVASLSGRMRRVNRTSWMFSVSCVIS